MPLTSSHEFLNIGRGESFIKNYYFGLADKGVESKIFICLAIKNKQASAEIMSQTVFEACKDVFFNSTISDDYSRFEMMLKEINKIFNKYKEDSISGDIGNINMIVGAVIDKTLHISQTGDAEAYLLRNKHLSVISDGLNEGGKQNTFLNIASGEVDEGDSIIFCSTRLLRYITKHDLTKIFSASGNIEKELGKLKSLLEVETLDQMGINIVKLSNVAEKVAKKAGRFQIQEILTTIKNHPIVKKLSRKKLEEKLEENLEVATKPKTPKGPKGPNLLDKIKSVSSSLFSKEGRQDKDFKKKQILAALSGVIVVLLVSIIVLRFTGNKQQMLDGYENTLAQVQEDIDKAYTIGITDKKKATEMLTQAEEKTKEILQSGYLRGLAAQRLDSIQEIKEKLDGIKKVENPKLFADIGAVKSDSNSIGINPFLNHLAVNEPTGVHEVVLSKVEKENEIEDGEEMIDSVYFEDQKSLVLMTKSGKVVEYSDGRFQFMDTQDTGWKTGEDVKSFGSKIYILDSSNNQIWKYTRRRENYSGADTYLGSETDLSGSIAMAIDGSIYVLNEDGTIRRFYGGEEEDLIIKKAPLTELQNPTAIYTEFESPNLYILEPSKQRVLVYTKEPRTGNLSYSYQLKFPSLKDIRDIHVDKKNSKLYVLADEKIFETAL